MIELPHAAYAVRFRRDGCQRILHCTALHCTALHRNERLGPMLQWALVRVKKLSAHGKVSV